MEFFDCNASYGIFSVPPYKRADTVEELIKEIGEYTAKLRLHKEVQIEVPFEIVSE